jgi:hypothetical protein
MNPTRHAAMSGGWAVTGQKRGVVRAGARLPGDNTAHVSLPNGLGLDGQGIADPALKPTKSAEGCRKILREGSSPEAETGFPPSGSTGLGERCAQSPVRISACANAAKNF